MPYCILASICTLLIFHESKGKNDAPAYHLHALADTTGEPKLTPLIEHWVDFLHETDPDKQKDFWHPEELKEWGSRFFMAHNIFQFPREHFFEVFTPYILSVECRNDSFCRIETSFEQEGFILEDTLPEANQNPMGIIEVGIQKNENGDLHLTNLFDERTGGYQSFTEGKFEYLVDPNLDPDPEEIEEAIAYADSLAAIFDTEYDSIRFVVCRDPKELGYIKGFNFMFGGYTTGIAYRDAQTIISGLGEFNYPHEIGHLIIDTAVGEVNHFFNERVVTFFGGSGNRTYEELLEDFREQFSQIDREKSEEINQHPGSPHYTLSALFVEAMYEEGGVELLTSFEEGVTTDPWEFIKMAADKMDMDEEELLGKVNERLEGE